MTKDDIIKLAREAGFEKVVAIHPDGAKTVTVAPVPELLAFANLVAAAEREACAKGKRGSIALARSLCYEIAGATSEDDMDGGGYGSVDIAEILSAEVVRLQKALAQPKAEPVAWAVQACSKMWRGEFAEIDAKAEAKRIGGTCVAYPLYTAQRDWAGLTDEDWEKVANRKNTVLDTFEQGATWAAYKLERRNK